MSDELEDRMTYATLDDKFHASLVNGELVFTDEVSGVTTRTRSKLRPWQRSLREPGGKKLNRGLARNVRLQLRKYRTAMVNEGYLLPTPVPTSLNWKQAQTRVAFALLSCMVAALFTASNSGLHDYRTLIETVLPAAVFIYQIYTMIRAYPANWWRFFGTAVVVIVIDWGVWAYCTMVL